MAKTADEIWEIVNMAAERGWKCSLWFTSGEDFKAAFITHIDEENRAFVVERVGERHLKPKLVYNSDLKDAQLHW